MVPVRRFTTAKRVQLVPQPHLTIVNLPAKFTPSLAIVRLMSVRYFEPIGWLLKLIFGDSMGSTGVWNWLSSHASMSEGELASSVKTIVTRSMFPSG